MSRLAKKPIPVPSDVDVHCISTEITVKGPNGVWREHYPESIVFRQTPEGITVRQADGYNDDHRPLVGLWVRLLKNMITGVTKGFERSIEVQGIGYKVNVQGNTVVLDIGFSHPVNVPIPEGLKAIAEKNTLTVRGVNNVQVGGFVTALRNLRPPEPYKGKGIRLTGEVVRRKAGKAAKAAGTK